MDLSRYTTLFQSESREQLGLCGQGLLEWEREPGRAEPLLTAFRAMHTFKGMAAAMGFTALTELAHQSETLLERLRADPLGGRERTDLLLRVVDALERGAPVAAQGGESRLDFSPLLAELAQAMAGTPAAAESAPVAAAVAPTAGGGRRVRIAIRSGAAMRGARAILVLQRAEQLGRVSGLEPGVEAMELDGFDGKFSFWFEAALDDAGLAEALRKVGEVAQVEVTSGAAEAVTTAERGRQIRIDLAGLDAVTNLVGELVVAKGRLGALAADLGSADLQTAVSRIDRISSDLHAEVIEMRLAPVWQVFDRIPRVVRELARQLGRRVRVEVEGEDTRLDRASLEEIGEPLIHLLRNAVDHGIELPAERARLGKPAEGLIRVTASSDRTTVVIQVSDDGSGVNRERVLAKALRMGFVSAGTTELDDDQLLRVLGRPGFSTAKAVTDVSGRGMGMDVVLSRLRALGGSVELRSTPGAGSVFTLRLPMTLAVVQALLARVGAEQYAIPLAGIAETVDFLPDRLALVDGREAFLLRDEAVRTVHLRERLGVVGPRQPGRRPAVIVEVGERRAAVVVDALLGQQEIVVESFDAPRGTLPVFSGATILGDGVPALIVDPAALV
ncbi:MAG TPA: chemotaxis protein CheA [Gemmatimonadales bacterium]|nr:chemotaxis protein CheA [Gemmatimonadales bacterium]